MYSNFLVPFDGSESSARAVKTAMEVSGGAGNIDVTVLQVLRMGDSDRSTLAVAADLAKFAMPDCDGSQESVQEYFDGLPEFVDLKIVVKRGNPADVICDYARDNEIDCIVMGRRGLGGIRAVLGSVSSAVLRDTDLPVLVVK